jgi:hypothetical protein
MNRRFPWMVSFRRRSRSLLLLLLILALAGLAHSAAADDPPPATPTAPAASTTTPSSAPGSSTESSPSTAAGGTNRALLICGLTGGGERRQAFADWLLEIRSALVEQWEFAPENVQLLFGDDDRAGLAEPIASAPQATRENVQQQIELLRQKLQSQDTLWVIVLGHTHYDGKNSWLNLPGPDVHQADFGKWFAGIGCRQQVFLMTTSASGFYVKPLSAPNRVVITATEADWETNETEFAGELARVLRSPPSLDELDIDRDGQATWLDLYLVVARNIAQSYHERELLATEHSLLDDNGDGRGTEVQIHYLKPELGGRADVGLGKSPGLPAVSDGHHARTILLPAKAGP